MAEYIGCRECDSPYCKGCNLKNLETMLRNGKFDCIMNGNRCINTAADVAPVRHGKWEWLGPNMLVRGCMCGTCSACKVRSKYIVNTALCPHCGAKMDECNESEN
jgi:hypothetical protein|nr:MAG TPA: zinc-ribbon containing domain protein [Caudoviricetes sp.]